MSRRPDALAIWQAGVDAVRPARFMPGLVCAEHENRLLLAGLPFEIRGEGALIVVGAGKAAPGMARAFEEALPPPLRRRVRGLVNVLDSAADETREPILFHGARPAGNPLPTPAGEAGSRVMLEQVARARPDDLVVALLSGGASALMPLPVDGVSLAEKRTATDLLSKAGASIGELNAVRKHLSRIKGGRLAEASRAGRWISLILSDVIGNPLDVIASGPSAPDPTTYAEALDVLHRFKLETRVPPSVRNHLERGAQGLEPETPKSLPETVINAIVADNSRALRAAAAEAERLGYTVVTESEPLRGVARNEGAALAGRALQRKAATPVKPLCILAGGEPVVPRVVPGGKGGRCQELALGAYPALAGAGLDACLLAAGTDGEDGPTDAAGAFCDGELAKAAQRQRLDPAAYFIASRTYDFFARTGGLLKTGPTGTNVMDLVILLV